METRRLVIAMVVALVAVLGWNYAIQYIGHRNGWAVGPKPPTTQQVASTTAAEQGVATTTEVVPGGVATTQAVATTGPVMSASGALQVVGAATDAATTQPTVVTVGSAIRDDATYAMGITADPRGAGIGEVALNQFKQAVRSNAPYTFQSPIKGREDATRPLATDSITIDGKTVSLEGVKWQVVEQTQNATTFAVQVNDPAGKPLVRVVKRFEVPPKTDPSLGYEAKVTQRVENLSGRELRVQLKLNGPVPALREMDASDDRQVIAGYPSNGAVTVGHWMLPEFQKEHTTRDLTTNDKGLAMAWAGMSSVYFDAIVLPQPASAGQVPIPLAKVEATGLNPDADPLHREVAMTLHTAEVSVPPGASAELPLNVFFGPKKRDVLNTAYYSSAPRGYQQTLLTMSSGMCGFCAFQPIINLLVMMLRGFHFVLRDWGLAIIALVFVVRLILHPITKQSQLSMHRMQKMAPEMERLKQKYKDQPDELNKAMIQFHKEQGVGPYLGCLPMFLQMPIWIALWTSLQSTFELRHAPFLHPGGVPLTWIHDLAKPDALVSFNNPIPIPLIFTTWHLHSINLLPIVMGVVFYLQQKFTPKPATMTPEQEQQQKMMLWMSVLLFPLMLYTGPSGLNLYIMTSTTFGILESKRIRDHIKEKEEAEKAGRVFVEPTRKMKKRRGDDDLGAAGVRRTDPKTPQGGLTGWFAKMQQMAEEMRKEQERKQKGK